MKKILIVDGNSILNRAFYGVKPLTTKENIPTNAVFGMYNIITKNVAAVSPDYCVVAFDLKAPTFRHKMYDGYKATRHAMPDELAQQLPYAKECMRNIGFTVLEKEGYEADDIIGTIANEAAKNGVYAYVLTGDRDSLQLIGDSITVLLATNKETLNYDTKLFVENYGISPSQLVDVKALMGDTSDNIPGVAGIGEKTALKLISEFSSLDSLYSSYLDSKLTPSVKNKLTEGKENAYLSQRLARIDINTPLDFDLDSYAYNGIDRIPLKALFEKLEFHGLIKRLGLDNISVSDSEAGEHGEDQTENITTVLSEAVSCEEFCNIAANKLIAVCISEDSISAHDGERLVNCPFNKENSDKLIEVLNASNVIVHDSKAYYKMLFRYTSEPQPVHFDTMLAAYCLNSSRKSYSLSEVYLAYVGHSLEGSTQQEVAVFELYSVMKELIENEGNDHLLYDIELPLAIVLADMEITGVKVDIDGIGEYKNELSELADMLKERIYYFAGEEFNIDSHKQLGEILFTKLGLPVYKKNKTGFSTDAEVLNKLRGKHEIIDDIIDYRQVSKLISTYTDGLITLADDQKRIHSIFNQTGTSTGRLSSAEPNLQNIPVKTELGRRFRQYFVPKDDNYVIIDADYSQIELRLLAHISNDEAMISAFANGEDIHTSTAARVFNVSKEEVTQELRKRAKAVNFGIVYGIGEYSLSEDLGISMSQAKKYIESYLAGYPNVNKYLNDIKETAKESGYVTTLYGRKRYIPELAASNKNLRNFGERVAMNSPIQGTAADIIKLAMINTYKRLKSEGLDARIILQVHDELLLEAHADCADIALTLLREEMENVISLKVPLDVEAHIGKNWLEAK